jgi:hypothetical protein
MGVVIPKPAVSCPGIVVAEYPEGAEVTVEVTVPYSVCAVPA